MPTQIPKSISNITTGINSFSNLILISPEENVGYYAQPNAIPAGATEQESTSGGFLFDYEGENTVTLESDITDHYVENNSTVSDQIAIKPVVVTVQGFVAELNDILPIVDNLIGTIQSKLSTLSPYTPEVSATGLIALNEAILAYEVIANTVDSVEQTLSFLGLDSYQNKQQKAFAKFFQAYNAKTLFTIQTPWTVFKNMAIKSLRAIQNPDTRMITDFEITFKQINFVTTKNLVAIEQERALSQYGKEVNLGVNNTNKTDKTMSGIYGNLGVSS